MKSRLKIIILLFLFIPLNAFAGSQGLSKDEAFEKMRSLSGDALSIKWKESKNIIRSIAGLKVKGVGRTVEAMAKDFINEYKVLFGIKNVAEDVELDHTDSVSGGSSIYVHFNQKSRGLDVMGGKITIRIENGYITSVMNHYTQALPPSVKPALSAGQAESIARAAVKLSKEQALTNLVILPWEGTIYLAYRIDFEKTSAPSKYRVYVDAQNASVIFIENRIMHNGPAIGSGVGVDGVMKSFDTYNMGSAFYLGNEIIPDSGLTIKTYTANNGKTLPGLLMKDSDNFWVDPAAVDAHFYGNFVLDFYKDNYADFTWFAGSGFQKSGGLVSTVHYDEGYDNAYWDGSQMVYGDGDLVFYPLSGALDIVAHEITHGVTEAINNLTYCTEPGALNESWSDVMGMFISIAYDDDLPYWSAEEVMKIAETPGYEAYYALRRLDDPSFRSDAYAVNDYDPLHPLDSWGQPEHMSEKFVAKCWPWNDNGGVHVNSGIPNKAAYLITIDTGAAKAQQIYYNAMFYLSSNSQFTDARNAVELAAIDLYGAGSAELAAVQGAFDSVGIY